MVLSIYLTFFELHRLIDHRYNLRNGGHNLVQPSYNNKFYHNSFTYKLSHLWNKLPSDFKETTKLSEFLSKLKSFDFGNLGAICQCKSCLA